ncbi:GTPase RsgA [Salinisphaera sp. T5B8]|uniref:ribosome small subunit-dependent GTPase A n=1 Tax=Salinisphaera sp. T5B8 TaxID=1304154 RepID=UPI0033429317
MPDIAALRQIGWPYATTRAADGPWAALQSEYSLARPARVVEQHRSGYLVAEDIERSYPVESLPDWQRPRLHAEQRPAVGDWLLVTGGEESLARALALLPRRSAIKRSSAGKHYGQQIIAANIDIVFIVSSLDGDFNIRRIERYLLLVGGGAQPVVVLTKADIAEDHDPGVIARATNALAALGVAVCTLNARDPASVDVLKRWLAPGITAVLVGSSGVGKSTLTNTLTGEQVMKTGAVRTSDARGRHTTTHRCLIALAGDACLIDTPGMRELKPTGEEDLREDGFADIEALALECRFRDCRHIGEPGCAIRAAIETGELDAARFENYRKLGSEIGQAAAQLASRNTRNSGPKKPSRTAKRRKRPR